MVEQDSFSNENQNLSASQPTIENNDNRVAQTKPKSKRVLIITLMVVIIFGAVAAMYFLIPRTEPEPEEENVPTESHETTSYVSDGEESKNKMIEALDNKINEASTTEDKASANLNKVTYLIAMEDYSAAKTALESIDTSGFNDYELYAYYNSFVAVYEGLEDTENAAKYEALANAAHEKDLNNFKTTEE